MDTPEHANLGDHAIALTERQVLTDWYGPDSFFEIPANRIDGFEKAFASLSSCFQVILVQGGGFLGVLWQEEELRVRRILSAFAGHRVIIFPQTITLDWSTPENRRFSEDSIQSYIDCPDLVICCRERESLGMMKREAPQVQTILSPDIVLCLRAPRFDAARDHVLICMRADEEAELTSSGVESLQASLRRAFPGLPIESTDTVIEKCVSLNERSCEVENKLREFASARLVVTDRLHGMLFCAITGTPVIALNNCNGKVLGVYDWISDLPYVQFARSVHEAVALIEMGAPEPSDYPNGFLDREFQGLHDLLGETK